MVQKKVELHSDVLRRKYGEIHLVVLWHDKRLRVVNLVDRYGITRTHAVTFFHFNKDKTGMETISAIDREIKNGGFMGETFRKHGYHVIRDVLGGFRIPMPSTLRKDFDFTEINVRALKLLVEKAGQPTIWYGTILEVGDFHPGIPGSFSEADVQLLRALRRVAAKHFNVAIRSISDIRKDPEMREV